MFYEGAPLTAMWKTGFVYFDTIPKVLQELQGDARFPQVVDHSIQLVLAKWAVEISEDFNMPLLKFLSSEKECPHSKKEFFFF